MLLFNDVKERQLLKNLSIKEYFIYLYTCVFYVHNLSTNSMLKMNHRVARGRTQHISRNEGDMAYDASFQIYFISYMSLINTIFEIPTAKRHKGSNLVILLARKVRKMTRSLGKFA